MKKDYHTENKSFMVYKDWEEYITLLSDEECGRLFKALFAFSKRAEEYDFEGAMKMVFIMMKNTLERDGHKWEDTCSKRSEAGKLGGRPPKKPKVFSEKAKKADKEKDKDKDRDTEKDKVEKDISFSLSPSQKQNIHSVENPTHHKYGKYQNIQLTDKQYNELVSEFGQALVDEYIDRVDEYCEMKGVEYQNCYVAIKKWLREDKTSDSHAKYQNNAPNKQQNDETSYDLDEWESWAMSFTPTIMP